MGDLQLLTVGRVSVDLYAQQGGVSMTEVQTFAKSIGGTATNVAVAAARFGHRAGLVTKVGDDQFGRYIRHALENTFGVDTTFVQTHPTLKTPLAFAERLPPEEPSIIFYREPKAPDMELVPADVDRQVIEDVDIFWIPASRFHDEPSRTTVATFLQWRERRRHTVIDLDWRPMFWASEAEARHHIEPMLEHVTMAVGNRKECEVAIGISDPEKAAEELLARGLEAAIVKLGGDGVLVATADGVRQQIAPFPVEVVCGLGAGDAFGGALVHGILSGWDLVDSVRYGNAAGAIQATRVMCADDMPTVAEVDSFMGEGA
ncbi:MAG: 5-dehydro-2-deoxygluconokinase [Actinomycetia bacterium]|nr:5-dehydro-2-deoxygluconokinase [Actinomycetes bacterium]